MLSKLISHLDIKEIYPNDLGTIAYFKYITKDFPKDKVKLVGSRNKTRYFTIQDIEDKLSELLARSGKNKINPEKLENIKRIKEILKVKKSGDII